MRKCVWKGGEFFPCEKFEVSEKHSVVSYRLAREKKENGCSRSITTCPFCFSALNDVEKINEESNTLCKFQIRNVDKNGCGSFYYVTAPILSTLDEIKELIVDHLTELREKEESRKYFSYFGGSRNEIGIRNMEVVELNVQDNKVKIRGRKAKVFLSRVVFKGKNAFTKQSFEKKYSCFDLEWVVGKIKGEEIKC